MGRKREGGEGGHHLYTLTHTHKVFLLGKDGEDVTSAAWCVRLCSKKAWGIGRLVGSLSDLRYFLLREDTDRYKDKGTGTATAIAARISSV